jgi:argininosuccinate lyase
VARPTTAGHWALSFAYPALRDAARFRADHVWVNRSPAGVDGARFGVDREAIAAALGFTEPVAHARDAIWQTDGLAELTSHAAIAAVGASRFAEDLELYGSDEFGLLRIGDELCRASAQMPQKRNPYALVVLRGGAGTLIGRATGVLASQRTPSGRTDNLLYAYGEVAGAVDLAARLLRLAAACAESVTVDAGRAAALLRGSFATATDLAEAITLATGLDYRAAYRAVGRAIADGGSLDPAALDAAAREILGRPLELDPQLVAGALEPVAREPIDAMLRDCREQVGRGRAWVDARRRAADDAERELVERARSGARGGGVQ